MKTQLFTALDAACLNMKKAAPSQKMEYSVDVLSAWNKIAEMGAAPKFGVFATDTLKRRNTMQGELRQVGIKSPDKIAIASVRNDAAFLVTVVAVTSVGAVLGSLLPGEAGFFAAYGIGGISIVVLAIGSTAPGLLAVFIDAFSQLWPDYRERVLGHEAAHFLAGYLLGFPVTGYSVRLGQEHTEFAEVKIQKRIIERQLTEEEIDQLAVMAVAGIAAEGRKYEEIMGQTADLSDLQRYLLRSKTRLSDSQQQNITRWAVFTAGGLLKRYEKEHTALIEAMGKGATVAECLQAIESA